jgi:hypothetical protein
MSNTEAYTGPRGVYLPELLSSEHVQLGSEITCALTRLLPGTADYSPSDIYTLDFKTEAAFAFETALSAIEQELADQMILIIRLTHRTLVAVYSNAGSWPRPHRPHMRLDS